MVREVWCHFTAPGTFRSYIRASWNGLTGKGWSWSHVPSFRLKGGGGHRRKRTDTGTNQHSHHPYQYHRLHPASASAIIASASTSAKPTFTDLARVGRPPLGLYRGPDPAVLQQGGWYVGPEDLHFFKYRCEARRKTRKNRNTDTSGSSVTKRGDPEDLFTSGGEVPGASAWENMMDKRIGDDLRYVAFRRSLPSGKTEYKSITYVRNATGEEVTDFYLDDPARCKWDSLLTETDVLEDGNFGQRRQVVRWVRTFPFSFIKQREYVIGRQIWREPDDDDDDEQEKRKEEEEGHHHHHHHHHHHREGSGYKYYTISKSVNHPRCPETPGIVRCETFYSMWRARTIPCPWGSPQPACEVLLLHHEDFKIMERLAKFAVKTGMWGFIGGMHRHFGPWVARRRQRCEPHAFPDPCGFGAGRPVNPLDQDELTTTTKRLPLTPVVLDTDDSLITTDDESFDPSDAQGLDDNMSTVDAERLVVSKERGTLYIHIYRVFSLSSHVTLVPRGPWTPGHPPQPLPPFVLLYMLCPVDRCRHAAFRLPRPLFFFFCFRHVCRQPASWSGGSCTLLDSYCYL